MLTIATVARAEVIDADVCVYGGTASGVTAAVEVARQGKNVVLLEPGQHVGGMTTGGLGATDIGNKDVIGGLSREFYKRVATHYSKDSSWIQETREHFFANRSKRTKLSEVQGENATMWTFEPHVAERILNDMLNEVGVPVCLGERLSLVKKEGSRIAEIRLESGVTVRAKMFIDATYEGDLMAKAGVSYRVGREANAVYQETLNGIRGETPKNQIYGSVDPYVNPGDPMSGLIPLIQRGSGGIPGDGDQRVQAYNFRLCFTNVSENRRELKPPANYDPAVYELVARRVEKIVASGAKPNMHHFCNPVWMPNGKTDINNSQGISTDFIGENYDYPDADYASRAEIWKAHENYVRGFWYFMSTSPRVPEALRQEFNSFGPCKDEFLDTQGWSHQMYVREARRMVSDYVMTEHNCRSKAVAEDPIGMAAYGMDSHNCQRIVQGGAARNEGDVQKHGLRPYPISYRSIVPRSDECENLLVPVCVSATHIAFGSIRMEPVFMVLGQSAGSAAALAIDEKIAVQNVDYEALRRVLLAGDQVLKRPRKPKPKAGVKGKSTKAKRRFNVLFVVSDDLRPELGCYGVERVISPHIDRLASQGMLFERAYCQQAVCSPSRSSVMTGARPDTTRVWDLTTHFRKAMPDVVTLPQLFKDHGYVTQGLGKIYHGDTLDDAPSWSKGALAADSKPENRGALSKIATARSKKPSRRKRGPAFRVSDDPPHGGGDGQTADEAIAALRHYKKSSQPFFLAVGFRKPHLPFVVPKAYWDLYDAQKIPRATNRFLPHGAPSHALVDRNEMWSYRGVPDTSDLPEAYACQLKHGYYAAVSYMDAQLGRVLDELDSLKIREETIVVLWGDHGWKLGEHNRWCKHSNVEDDTRAPLIISVPGKSHGKRTNALVEFVDIYPTLAELAGIELPDHLEGLSLEPLLDAPDRPWKRAVFSQYPRKVDGVKLMGYSMRTDRYRLTRWVHSDDHSRVHSIELYDHQVDPQENTNIAQEPGRQALVATLTRQWNAGWQGAIPAEPSSNLNGNQQSDGPPRIVCFGDSITKRGYPAELQKLLGVNVLNSGVAGHTTQHGLRRIKSDLLDHSPEVAVILFGTNDCRLAEEHVHVPVDEYAANLRTMVKECSARNISTVICTLPPIDAEPYFERHKKENFTKAGGLATVLESYRQAAKKVAEELEVPLVDLHQSLSTTPAWMHHDGVHPSSEGNRIIAQLIAVHLESRFKTKQPTAN